MSIPVVSFFNNKGGVGKTSMVYHLSWMLAELGRRVLATDLDPQANLTAAFLDEDRLEAVLSSEDHAETVFGSLLPLQRGIGDIAPAHVEPVAENLGVVPGDMALSTFEDQLSEAWPKCNDGDERSFRVMSAFWRIMQEAAERRGAEVVLVDLGPNLGAINRAALIASDFVVIPLGPDLFSIQGLQNLGPALMRWRGQWGERLRKNPNPELPLPAGRIQPLGYVVLRHSIRLDRPVQALDRWIARIPQAYAKSVLGTLAEVGLGIDADPNCIAKLRDYRSLMPLALEARKPMFFLKAADGALGAHTYAVADAHRDFAEVARRIAARIGLHPMG